MRPSDFPDERTLVPYEASTFLGRRVVVFAPHPDDEILGCGAALADLLDGGARIASRRFGESRRALDALGGGALHAGGFPDRGLAQRLGEVEALLSRWLIEAAPDLVFAPSPVETHPDHRAVAAVGADCASLTTSVSPDARVDVAEAHDPVDHRVVRGVLTGVVKR